MSQPIVGTYQSNVTAAELGNVTVLDIKPKDWRDNGKVLVYVHGGGHTFLGANSTLGFAVPVANSTINVTRLNLVSNSQNWIHISTEIGNNVLIRYY